VIFGSHEGLKTAAAKVLSSTSWRSHAWHGRSAAARFMRNALAHVGPKRRQMAAAAIRAAFTQDTREAARDFTVRGGAALCILHDLRLAHDFGDEIVLMKRGRIAARGTPDILKPAAIASIFDIPEDRAERLAVL
jgi:ABC-type hemin transport system ATPase subunit